MWEGFAAAFAWARERVFAGGASGAQVSRAGGAVAADASGRRERFARAGAAGAVDGGEGGAVGAEVGVVAGVGLIGASEISTKRGATGNSRRDGDRGRTDGGARRGTPVTAGVSMGGMRLGLPLLAAVLFAEGAHAQPARRRGPTYDNGPRDVPVARGEDLARARRLGLGARRVMEAVVWRTRPPPAAWFAAAGAEAPRDFLWPVEGGVLWQAYGSMGGRHRALDIGLRCGATIRAAHAGLVVYSDNFLDGLGNAVVTVAPGGWVSIYGHARRTLVAVGARVARGQPIAEMGDTGAAVGCHVHFALLRDGVRVDPGPRMVGRPGRTPTLR